MEPKKNIQDYNQGPGIEFSMAVLCYRSEKEIIPFIEKLHHVMNLFRFEWEIVLVANYWKNSKDLTPEIAKKLSEKLDHVRYIAESKEGGMGWDMKRGLDACQGQYIGVIDGDGQFPVENIFSCFAKIKSENFDFVKTYRVFRKDGIYRNIISIVYNFFFKILYPKYRGFHDVNGKPKIMKREVYEKMELHTTDWFLDAELIINAMQMNLRIAELPVKFESLNGRGSFVKFAALLEFAKNLFKYRFKK